MSRKKMEIEVRSKKSWGHRSLIETAFQADHPQSHSDGKKIKIKIKKGEGGAGKEDVMSECGI